MKALEHLDQALAIDSSFLAAQLLRERVLAAPLAGGAVSSRSDQTPPSTTAQRAPTTTGAPAGTHATAPIVPNRPVLRGPAQAHQRIELRAKQRRVDHCIATTRAALGRGHLDQATAALNELIALEPTESNVTSLSAELADLRRRSSRRPFGVRLVAASAFLAVAGAASWLEHPRRPVPVVEVATAMKPGETTTPRPLAADDNAGARTPEPPLERIELVTSSDKPTAQTTTPVVVPTRPAAVFAARPTPPPSTTAPMSLPVPLSQLPPPAATTPEPDPPPATLATVPRGPSSTPAALIAAGAPTSASAVPVSVIRPPEDQQLVEEALQRYRRAYGRLNVQSALAVYPTVNRVALARAFEGLESQSLTFDSCDVELRGAAARAICHGSARYVPKIGSRELHTEPLVWSFELRKTEGDWTIESAKASR